MAGLLLCPWRTSRHFQLAQVLLTLAADANTQYTDTMDSDSDDDIPLAGLKKAAAKPDKAVSSSSAAAAAKKAKKRPNYKEDSDHDDEDDDDYDEPSPPKKKKKKSSSASTSSSSSAKKKKAASTKKSSKTPVKKENGSSKKSSKKSTKSTTTTPKGPKKLKQLDKSERISHAMQAYLWWNADDPPKGQQWVKMEHAGVSFPEAYEPHGVKMRYDGKEVDLTPLQEEAWV